MAILPVLFVMALIGWAIGASNHKHRGGEGFLLGLLLGPLGWLIVAVLGPSRRARREQLEQERRAHLEQLEEHTMLVASAASAAAATSRTHSSADELRKLAALRDDGVLSDDEFAELKADVLERR